MSAGAGQKAEEVAAGYLRSMGFAVLDQNWRHTIAEIDIVATDQANLYFVEVKYRKNNFAGSGLAYVTHAKLAKMQKGAEMWMLTHNSPLPWCLSAIEVSGEDYEVTAFVKNAF